MSTSLKPPRSAPVFHARISGASNPHQLFSGLAGRIYAELPERFDDRAPVDLVSIRKRLERRQRDEMPIDFEVPAQWRACIRATEAVCSQCDVTAGHPLTDLIGNGAHVVGGGNYR